MEYTANDFMSAIRFIKAYREMEGRTLPVNKKFIASVVDANQLKHLSQSWAGRNNDFGSFFLNLSHGNQAKFIIKFGIEVPGYAEYLNDLASSPAAYIFVTPPLVVSQLHELLKFFYNHGIDENAVPGIKLYHLPENCYGNSTNWGKYILSLSMPEQLTILKQIALNATDNIRQDEENRLFLKEANQKANLPGY